jgi:maleylpyruvate isomerase
VGSTKPVGDLEGCRAAHRRLLETLRSLDDDTARRASLLPDWTVGHVVTHLARNADAPTGQFEAAARGEVAQMYPGGVEQRSDGIESGAARPADALVADLRDAIERLEAAWDATTDEVWRAGRARAGDLEYPLAFSPFRRWREVEIHHADLGLDFGYDDMSPAYVRRELDVTAGELVARISEGVTLELVAPDLGRTWVLDDGAERHTVEASATRLLAWLFGRIELPDTPPLATWQREDR